MTFHTFSKLYLSGIEILKTFNNSGSSTPPNCTLVELKFGNKRQNNREDASPNCTLVELK